MVLPGRRFETKDPLGRTVFCGQDSWGHICRDHPDLATLAPLIQDVVEHPDEIYADADIPDRECYYRFSTQVHGIQCSLKVVVSFGVLSRFLGGAVVTAFEKFDAAPGHVKPREHKLWP